MLRGGRHCVSWFRHRDKPTQTNTEPMKNDTANLPANNQRIIFTQVPYGSWATVGEVYTVTIEGSYVRLKNDIGAGTFDRTWAYRDAQWGLA